MRSDFLKKKTADRPTIMRSVPVSRCLAARGVFLCGVCARKEEKRTRITRRLCATRPRTAVKPNTAISERTRLYIIQGRQGVGAVSPPGRSPYLRDFGILDKMGTLTCQVPRNVLVVVVVWCLRCNNQKVGETKDPPSESAQGGLLFCFYFPSARYRKSKV